MSVDASILTVERHESTRVRFEADLEWYDPVVFSQAPGILGLL